jgi:hypothetical protein
MLNTDGFFLVLVLNGKLEGDRGRHELARVSEKFRPVAERLLAAPWEERLSVWPLSHPSLLFADKFEPLVIGENDEPRNPRRASWRALPRGSAGGEHPRGRPPARYIPMLVRKSV